MFDEQYISKLRDMNLSESQIQSILKGLLSGTFEKVPGECEHFRLNSDLYGSTCIDCNKVISGKGFGASKTECIHIYEIDANNNMTCTYCGEPKDPNQKIDEIDE
ncbi:MAG: hypothetical protein Q8K92_25095 [Leadbetterella sp.]|jgi:hypothetical protein|nr:hypothetical protein [Leadbetterella sp.]